MPADAAIVQVATWTAVVAAGYLAVLVTVTVVRTHARAVKGVAGLGLVVGLTSGGVALAAPAHDGKRPPVAASVGWPVGSSEHRGRHVVVRPGDCLWAIAARRLDRPTASQVAAIWPRWWHTNRRVVGPDPDLIQPGQQLRPPVHARSRT